MVSSAMGFGREREAHIRFTLIESEPSPFGAGACKACALRCQP